MPPVINVEKCIGCGKCEICPGDLMEVNESTKKAFCRTSRDCWDCMACTKACPTGAIETKIPYQLGYYPAKLIPKMGNKQIEWTLIDINGKVERFIVKTHNK
ncbi:4Fe-4S binding protein [Desulforamulus aquiferis]|uniref:4Fe-4S dicluster domain-containing protein n=1 Tax=Desulforamulus aquiferis TaxID=1397668 RepID=A0AAW7Z665_9FIRM|nr:4Fe-4S binding protein [Desulforamulus aquiferis]MDO7785719.1 4Fe-4S dicluster domain-containing protein [Desulforamulus aquiferis]